MLITVLQKNSCKHNQSFSILNQQCECINDYEFMRNDKCVHRCDENHYYVAADRKCILCQHDIHALPQSASVSISRQFSKQKVRHNKCIEECTDGLQFNNGNCNKCPIKGQYAIRNNTCKYIHEICNEGDDVIWNHNARMCQYSKEHKYHYNEANKTNMTVEVENGIEVNVTTCPEQKSFNKYNNTNNMSACIDIYDVFDDVATNSSLLIDH